MNIALDFDAIFKSLPPPVQAKLGELDTPNPPWTLTEDSLLLDQHVQQKPPRQTLLAFKRKTSQDRDRYPHHHMKEADLIKRIEDVLSKPELQAERDVMLKLLQGIEHHAGPAATSRSTSFEPRLQPVEDRTIILRHAGVELKHTSESALLRIADARSAMKGRHLDLDEVFGLTPREADILVVLCEHPDMCDYKFLLDKCEEDLQADVRHTKDEIDSVLDQRYEEMNTHLERERDVAIQQVLHKMDLEFEEDLKRLRKYHEMQKQETQQHMMREADSFIQKAQLYRSVDEETMNQLILEWSRTEKVKNFAQYGRDSALFEKTFNESSMPCFITLAAKTQSSSLMRYCAMRLVQLPQLFDRNEVADVLSSLTDSEQLLLIRELPTEVLQQKMGGTLRKSLVQKEFAHRERALRLQYETMKPEQLYQLKPENVPFPAALQEELAVRAARARQEALLAEKKRLRRERRRQEEVGLHISWNKSTAAICRRHRWVRLNLLGAPQAYPLMQLSSTQRVRQQVKTYWEVNLTDIPAPEYCSVGIGVQVYYVEMNTDEASPDIPFPPDVSVSPTQHDQMVCGWSPIPPDSFMVHASTWQQDGYIYENGNTHHGPPTEAIESSSDGWYDAPTYKKGDVVGVGVHLSSLGLTSHITYFKNGSVTNINLPLPHPHVTQRTTFSHSGLSYLSVLAVPVLSLYLNQPEQEIVCSWDLWGPFKHLPAEYRPLVIEADLLTDSDSDSDDNRLLLSSTDELFHADQSPPRREMD